MSNSAAEARALIQSAIEDGGTHLDLGGLGLVTLPDLLGEAITVTHLTIRNNQLTELPAALGQLINLVQLSAANNQLTTLPDEIGRCRALTHLNLRNNQLKRLPPSIFALDCLESLQLMGNGVPLDETILGRWNRPDEILAAYRQKFPPPKPPPPPSFLVDQIARYFPHETIVELAETLTVPAEFLETADHRQLIDTFVAYHVRHGLETELRDLLQIWVPHRDWHHPQYELEERVD